MPPSRSRSPRRAAGTGGEASIGSLQTGAIVGTEQCGNCDIILGGKFGSKAAPVEGRLVTFCEPCCHLALLSELLRSYSLSAERRAVIASCLCDVLDFTRSVVDQQLQSEGEGGASSSHHAS